MPDPFGQQLRQAREARGLSIQEAALATRIRVHYLTALEEDRTSDLPSVVQARGFLRNYAEYLGLPAQELVDLWSGKTLEDSAPALTETPAEKKPTRRKSLFTEPPEPPEPVVISGTPATRESAGTARGIFEEIGQTLRVQRELLGLSLVEVEKAIHVRLHYLNALEAGQIEAIPSPVQGRGMLSNYAGFLNLNVDQLLNRFADGLQLRRSESLAALPPESRPGATRRVPGEQVSVDGLREPRRASPFSRIFSLDLLLGAGMVIFLIGFAIYAVTRVTANASQPPTPQNAPGISEILLASQTLEPAPSGTPELQETAPAADPVGPAGPVDQTQVPPELGLPTPSTPGDIQLVVVARNQAWLQISVDGQVEFQGRTEPGVAYPFAGNSHIELLTGNAAALQVFYNQTDMGSLGAWSEVVRLIFAAEGLQTPTPTVTPTATQTPRTTPTLPVPTGQP